MDTSQYTQDTVSFAEQNEGARWIGRATEISARLQAITENIQQVLTQEGISDEGSDAEIASEY